MLKPAYPAPGSRVQLPSGTEVARHRAGEPAPGCDGASVVLVVRDGVAGPPECRPVEFERAEGCRAGAEGVFVGSQRRWRPT